MFGFLFWLFLAGIIIASLQDLKRREVDNWLNLFLLLASFSFIFFQAIFDKNPELIYRAGFALILLFIFMNVFYYGRVFAGGDAKLLFAMTVFFVGATFVATMVNIGVFLLFLMLAGSIYGIVYSVVLYIMDYKEVNKKMKEGFSVLWVRYVMVLSVIFFILSYVNWQFLILAVFCLVFPLLYVFAKGLENVSMIRSIPGNKLREGDWLVDDVRVGKKLIKADWDGLSLDDVELLKKKRSVKIKEGLPFVPAFLIAFVMYVFLKDWFVDLLISLA